jgi:hypothetical protein
MIDRMRVERIGEVNLDIEVTESFIAETSTGALALSLLYMKPTKESWFPLNWSSCRKTSKCAGRICVGQHVMNDKQPNEHE